MLFLFSLSSSAQSDKFIIEGRLNVDGGSVNGSKIIVERDGRQIKSLDGQSKFEILLDFQSIYVISFEKEGFVTKRLRFDTHVPENRVEYGFEPFGFEVEIFEQYDDVNMVVFNQPVGKISYSELIDEFDYDTDYTKTIQSQLEQANKDMEEAKEKKAEQASKVKDEVSSLTKTAEKSAKSGDFTAAIKNYEEAQKLSKDPKVEDRIKELKEEQQKVEKQERFDAIVKEAEVAMAKGDLDEAQKLFNQANGVIANDSKVQSQLASIEKEKAKQEQEKAAFENAVKAANSSLSQGKYQDAIAKAEEALAIKGDPEMEKVISDARAALEEAEAKKVAEAEMNKEFESLIAEADQAADQKDYKTALAKYDEAKALKASPEVEEKIKSVNQAVAELEEEKKKQEQAKAQLDERIKAANDALASGELEKAKSLLAEAKALGDDDRLTSLSEAILEEEKRREEEAAAQKEAKEQVSKALADAEGALNSEEFDKAESLFNQAKEAGASEEQVEDGLKKVQAKRDSVKSAEEAAAKEKAERQQQVDDLIGDADKALAEGDYDEARSKLAEASAIQSDERIADLEKQIDKAEADALKERAKEGEIEEAYQAALGEANAKLSEGELDDAEKAFNKALSIKEGDATAMEGLKKIAEKREKLKANEAKAEAEKAAAERLKKYNDLISEGQSALSEGDLDKAESSFKNAKQFSDDPKEAKEGIAAIQDKREAMSNEEEEAARKKKEAAELEEFNNKVKEGDVAFERNEFEAARENYNEALLIKKDDYVNGQLKRIDDELAAKAEKDRLEEEARAKAEKEDVEPEETEAEKQGARLAAEEAKAKEAAAKAAEAEKVEKQKAFEAKMGEGDALIKANKLDQAISSFNEALAIKPESEDARKKIASTEALKKRLAEDREASRAAAQALTDQRGRESEQLAEILEKEENKSNSNKDEEDDSKPKTVRMAQGVMEEDTRPGSSPSKPVEISDLKVGEEALKTKTANLSEEEIYDGINKRVEEQQLERALSEEQMRLMEKYPSRRSVEIDSVGNSVVTKVFMNNGQFIKVYKKVEHNWGGVYYFVDEQATNQRFWEHETK